MTRAQCPVCLGWVDSLNLAEDLTDTLPEARVEYTAGGPVLYINDIKVNSWLGTMYEAEVHDLAVNLNRSFGHFDNQHNQAGE